MSSSSCMKSKDGFAKTANKDVEHKQDCADSNINLKMKKI